MNHQRGSGILLALLMSASAASGTDTPKNLSERLPLLTRHVEPKEFGIQDDTVTTISATSFVPNSDDVNTGGNIAAYYTSPTLGRFCQPNLDIHYYATLNIPAGSIIDFIGLNTMTDTDSIIGMALWQKTRAGAANPLASFSVPAHGWDTDFAGPLNIQIQSNADAALILDVEQAPSPNVQFFSYLEVRWRRTVSPPTTQSFADVPPSDPGFQYIQALVASGITAGCGGGNYCPDATLTRRQMAVFLAKALGLHWPN